MEAEDEVPTLLEPIISTRVPLTILTGYLGAGKTTLLQHILTENHGRRIAVIMNELANTADIESRTINVSSGTELSEEVLELANGCLCCTVKDSGAAAIERLMQKKGKFDYILLETTGVADPGPIAAMFWQNEELASDIYLDGVCCVVDAVFGSLQIQETTSDDDVNEALRQIACADVLLINKTDLVGHEALLQLESLISSINPTVETHPTVRGVIDLSHVLGLHAYDTVTMSSSHPYFASELHHTHGDSQDMHYEACAADCDHDHGVSSNHLNGISACVVDLPILQPEQVDRLDEFIRCLLWENRLPSLTAANSPGPFHILRCKGMFSAGSGRQYVLQGVRNIYDVSELDGNAETDRGGKIAFIGKGLGDGSVVRSALTSHLNIHN